MSALRGFRAIPKSLREWGRWFAEQNIESGLGNPDANDQVLVSDTSGNRSWKSISSISSDDSTGSFEATLTGCTTSPTGTVGYSVSSGLVTLQFPAISGTSNSTSATLTGLPEALYPVTAQSMIGITTDSGSDNISEISVGTDGVITLSDVLGSFTASGTKGVAACTITYRTA